MANDPHWHLYAAASLTFNLNECLADPYTKSCKDADAMAAAVEKHNAPAKKTKSKSRKK